MRIKARADNITNARVSAVDPVIAIILYGSSARGDQDSKSDIDVCVVCQDMSPSALERTAASAIRGMFISTPDITVYAVSEFEEMIARGSLFAWHLKLEGRLLVPKDKCLDDILPPIGQYSRATADIESYEQLLGDIELSPVPGDSVLFDMAMLFTIARNTCMVLCFTGGKPTFGRMDVFRVAQDLYGRQFAFAPSLYSQLAAWKLSYVRGKDPQDEPPITLMSEFFTHVAALLRFAKSSIGGTK